MPTVVLGAQKFTRQGTGEVVGNGGAGSPDNNLGMAHAWLVEKNIQLNQTNKKP